MASTLRRPRSLSCSSVNNLFPGMSSFNCGLQPGSFLLPGTFDLHPGKHPPPATALKANIGAGYGVKEKAIGVQPGGEAFIERADRAPQLGHQPQAHEGRTLVAEEGAVAI